MSTVVDCAIEELNAVFDPTEDVRGDYIDTEEFTFYYCVIDDLPIPPHAKGSLMLLFGPVTYADNI